MNYSDGKHSGKSKPAGTGANGRAVHRATRREDRGEDGERRPQESLATLLVEHATKSGIELWHTPAGESYATVTVDGHGEHYKIRSMLMKRWLRRLSHVHLKKAAADQTVTEAANTLDSIAAFEGAEREVFVRLAEYDGAIYLDLCDSQWRAIEITANGWRVVEHAPVAFRRAKGMMALCEPQRGGSLDELRAFVNVGDDDFLLMASWVVAAMRLRGPFPVLALHGEAGSAKSTVARMFRELVDPNEAPLRAEPRDTRDLAIAANNGWIVALDNVSTVPMWLSDALCRLATGGGFATRTLYENDEETIFHAMRPILLTGIEEVVTRGDLLDRSIPSCLPVIPKHVRRPESELWRAFNNVKPRVLGALLDAVSVGLRNVATVQLAELPRMADFATWAVASETGLGFAPGSFMRAYSGNREVANAIALDASPLARYVRELVDDRTDWQGSATELLAELDGRASEKDRKLKAWPVAGNVLSGKLKRLAPNLREEGIEVAIERGKRGSVITLGKVAQSIVTTVTIVDSDNTHGSAAAAAPAAITALPELSGMGTAAGDGGDGDDQLRTSTGRVVRV